MSGVAPVTLKCVTPVQIQTTGDMKKMSDSMSVLMTAILLSLLFIYLALTLLYNNWTDPLVVMIAIPLSVVGALLALALTNTAMSIYAMLGMVMLVGLVAKNAILLVDFANEARAVGAAGGRGTDTGGQAPYAPDPDDCSLDHHRYAPRCPLARLRC